ncbi:MAG: hypothetical protein D3906_02775 [Candidatus Electrothrix sp. AUS1_2]|nr:hypothetical protein [Candidatus Electrothrix sp. AUS1_2]
MSKKVIYCGLLSSLLLLNISVQDASAQQWASMAKRTSSQLVSGAWNSLGRDCSKADRLLQIVGDGVDRVTRDIRSGKFRGRAAVDFGRGYIEGLNNGMEVVVNQCTRECRMIGNASGDWSANIFCAVSEAIGGPADFGGMSDYPNLLCGEPYRMSCESTFVGVTGRMCRQYARGQNYENYYPASRRGCCAYDPR